MNLQNIDRRIMYILLGVVVAIPLFWDVIRQPIEITPEVRGVYNTIENIPQEKVAILSIIWGAGTTAENRPQTQAIARHLFKRGIRIIVLPFDLQGTKLSYDAVNEVAKEMGKEYGKDWISTGWRPPYLDQIILGMAKDLPATLKTDINGIKLDDFEKLPLMRGVKSYRDIGIVVDFTPSGSIDSWINYLGQPNDVPIAFSPTSVEVPAGYNKLDAKQICGMLPGLMGAAKYETLLKQRGFACRASNALSTSHLLIIVLIILGNLGYFFSTRARNMQWR